MKVFLKKNILSFIAGAIVAITFILGWNFFSAMNVIYKDDLTVQQIVGYLNQQAKANQSATPSPAIPSAPVK